MSTLKDRLADLPQGVNLTLEELVTLARRVEDDELGERVKAAMAQSVLDQADAARLNWLEQVCDEDMVIDLVVHWTYDGKRYPRGLRESIDAAMKDTL